MSYIFVHKRAGKAMGTRVPSGIQNIKYQPVTNGEGIFKMPDDTPKVTIEFLQSCGHKLLSNPKIIKKEVVIKKPPVIPMTLKEVQQAHHDKVKPQPKAKLPEADVETVEVSDNWPWDLIDIKGCGQKTVELVENLYKTPKALLDAKEIPEGINLKTWNKIKDYTIQRK